MFERLIRTWKILTSPTCQHHWRPALGMDKPVRYCDLCERHDPLTEAEFYAQFGKMPMRWNDGPMGGK
jgi:hypothetical protein